MVKKFTKTIIKFTVVAMMIFCVGVFLQSANFEVFAQEGAQYQIIVDVYSPGAYSMGRVDGAGKYAVGESVTLIATANEDCHFVIWQKKNGDSYENIEGATDVEFNFVVEEDANYRAVFAYTEYSFDCDFLTYFDLTSVSVEKNLVPESYLRADENTIFDSGVFYYNDILTLDFEHKLDTYVQKLDGGNFSSDSSRLNAVVNLTSLGKVTTIVMNGLETSFESLNMTLDELVSANNFSFDFDRYDYYVLTQTEAPERYTTTHIKLLTKVTADLSFSLNANQLMMFTIEAYDSENNLLDLTDENIKNLIKFESGYYGALDTSSAIFTYLVEKGSNYCFKFYSNSFYKYENATIGQVSTSDTISGYFNASTQKIIVRFTRIKYTISIQEYLKTGDSYTQLTEDLYFDIASYKLYPGQNIKVEMDEYVSFGKIYIDGELFEDLSKIESVKYGYRIFTISENLMDPSSAFSYQTSIDGTEPNDLIIYIVYEEIEYDLCFDVIDKLGNINSYFKQKVKTMNSDAKVSRGDNVILSAEVLFGYTYAWTMVKDREIISSDYLTDPELNFTFTPLDNDASKTYNYYLVVDYDYFNFSYNLTNTSFTAGKAVADLNLAEISSFEFDEFSNVITVYANVIGWESDSQQVLNNVLLLNETLTVNSAVENYTKYNSTLGEIIIHKDGSEFAYLTISGVNFEYNITNSKFEKPHPIDIDKNYVFTNDEVNNIRKISFTNLTVDDVILNFAVLSENGESFEFNYFTLDHKTQLSDYIISTEFTNVSRPTETHYIWMYNGAKSVDLYVAYSPVSQTIKVTRNLDVYAISDISCILTNTSLPEEKSEVEDIALVINAVNGTNIKIQIDFTKITKGYRFKEFKITTKVAVSLPSTTIESNTARIEFQMSNGFSGAEILVIFEEIEYSINISSNANFTAKISKTNLVEPEILSISGDYQTSFKLKVSELVYIPTLNIESLTGYYVSKAYINEESYELPSLVGNISSQTEGVLIFGTETSSGQIDFEQYIQNIANADDEVTLYLIQEARTYKVIVSYLLNNEKSAEYVKDATVQLTGDASPKTPSGTLVSIVFDSIPYNQTVELTVDDSNLVGANFMQWENASKTKLTDSYNISFVVTQSLELYVRFSCWPYTINFVSVDENENGLNYLEVGSAIMSTNDGDGEKISNNFNICDSVSFEVFEKTGYKFKELYYKYGNNSKSRNGIGGGDKTFSFEGKKLNNIEFFAEKTRNEQKVDTNRILTIYLVFAEKQYQIKTFVKNNTVGSASNINTDGWLDISVYYYNNESSQYISKEADDDGFVKFNTNSLIKICFKQQINGINFSEVQLGSTAYFVTNNGETSVAGQTVQLIRDGNTISLYFSLSTTLLKTVQSSSDEFNISILYYVKNYQINFSLGALANDALGANILNVINLKYQLSMKIYLPDNLFGWTNISGADVVAHQLHPTNKLYYDTNIEFSVTVTQQSINRKFKESYDFVGFMVNGVYVDLVSDDNRQNDSYTLQKLALPKDETEKINLWEFADDDVLNVYAVYTPKISLDEGSFIVQEDGSYLKTVTYNGKQHKLTTSLDAKVDTSILPDVIFNADEFTTCLIYYDGSSTNFPKDVKSGTDKRYEINIVVGGLKFDKKIYLEIKPCVVQLIYRGGILTKEYDGSNDLTAGNQITITDFLSLKIKNSDYTGKLCENDEISFNFTNMRGYYSKASVEENLNIYLNNVKLGVSLKDNYCFEDGTKDTSVDLIGMGRITPRKAYIDNSLFAFYDIVYKPNENYKLKFKESSLLLPSGDYKEGVALTIINKVLDSDEVYFNLDKIKITLSDYSIGTNKKITINLMDAIAGANSINYTIDDLHYYIDIYPYKLEITFENGEKFSIVDLDEICCIPIELGLGGKLEAKFIDSTNPDYPNLFGVIEKLIKNDDRIFAFYEFGLFGGAGNSIEINTIKGAYVVLSNVKELKTIYERTDNGYIDTQYFVQDGEIFYKIGTDSRGGACVIVDRSYFPIWKLILILVLILLFIGLIILIILIIKRKRKKDDEEIERNISENYKN